MISRLRRVSIFGSVPATTATYIDPNKISAISPAGDYEAVDDACSIRKVSYRCAGQIPQGDDGSPVRTRRGDRRSYLDTDSSSAREPLTWWNDGACARDPHRYDRYACLSRSRERSQVEGPDARRSGQTPFGEAGDAFSGAEQAHKSVGKDGGVVRRTTPGEDTAQVRQEAPYERLPGEHCSDDEDHWLVQSEDKHGTVDKALVVGDYYERSRVGHRPAHLERNPRVSRWTHLAPNRAAK
jgi:hypothetical protein